MLDMIVAGIVFCYYGKLFSSLVNFICKLFFRPVIIRHVIDEESPLYGMTQESMRHADFELIMTVEGIVEATGMTFQARTSFLPNEIFWGQK